MKLSQNLRPSFKKGSTGSATYQEQIPERPLLVRFTNTGARPPESPCTNLARQHWPEFRALMPDQGFLAGQLFIDALCLFCGRQRVG